MNEFEIIHYPQINGLTLFFDTVDYRTPHVHPELELIWVVSGSLSISVGTEEHTVPEDTLVIFDPAQPHEFHKHGASCTFLCLQVSPDCFAHTFPALKRTVLADRFPDRYLSEAEREGLRERLLELTRAYFTRPPCYELYCTAQAGLLLHTLLTALPVRAITPAEATDQERRNARLLRLFRFVDENYMHKIRLSDFAEQEGRSVSYLSHFIKETMNQTFQDYVNTVRFNAARKLIDQGSRRMLEVCLESGFSDYRYFSRTFQSRLGLTPEEYSRTSRADVPETIHVHHSIHSLERFYSRERCIQLLEKLEESRQKGDPSVFSDAI